MASPCLVCMSGLSLQGESASSHGPNTRTSGQLAALVCVCVCAVGVDDVVNLALFNSQTVRTGYSSVQLKLRHTIAVNPDESAVVCGVCEKLLAVPTHFESASLPCWFLYDIEDGRKCTSPAQALICPECQQSLSVGS